MPSITSNIPSIIVYSFTMSELVKIAGSTLLPENFLPVAKMFIRSNDQSSWFQTVAFKTD